MAIYDEVKAIELFEQSASVLPRTDLADLQKVCEYVAAMQRAVLWWVGDLALAAERQHPTTHFQVWPDWVSPDMIARCKAVSEAYKPEERNLYATWSTHMHLSKRVDRVEAVQMAVEDGLTSDAVRKNPPPPMEVPPVETEAEQTAEPETPPVDSTPAPVDKTRWLLAVDVNYWIHRYFHSGAGVEAASTFLGWLIRLIDRLKEKGLTDVACCFDSTTNHRKKLTETWEHQYKGNRGQKDHELAGMIMVARPVLEARNFCCVSIEDMEADDVMASYAKQFEGRVTLLTQDKDMRQCLSAKCNILLDVTWQEHTETNAFIPSYKWVSAKSHTEETGLRPDQWVCKQLLFGDAVDNIKGAGSIGDVGATKLVVEFGSAKAAMDAAKRHDSRLLAMKRGKIMLAGLLDLEERFDMTRQLVELRVDLNVPQTTRI